MPVLFPYLLERIFQFIKFNFCIQIINFSIIDPILQSLPTLPSSASLHDLRDPLARNSCVSRMRNINIQGICAIVRIFRFDRLERLVLFVQENRRSLHSSFIFILFLPRSRLFQCTRTGRNYWPSTTSGFNFSRDVEDFFSYDRRNFHAGKYYRSLTSERLVSSMM